MVNVLTGGAIIVSLVALVAVLFHIYREHPKEAGVISKDAQKLGGYMQIAEKVTSQVAALISQGLSDPNISDEDLKALIKKDATNIIADLGIDLPQSFIDLILQGAFYMAKQILNKPKMPGVVQHNQSPTPPSAGASGPQKVVINGGK